MQASLAPTVTAPPDVVDAQIARALAATVVDLDAARRSRRRPQVLAAAAAIAGVFLVGALLALQGGSDDAELADGTSTVTAATSAADAAPAPMLEAETAAATASYGTGAADAGAAGTTEADLREGGPSAEDAEAAEAVIEVPDAAVADAIRTLLDSGDASTVPADTACTDVSETMTDLVGPVETSGVVEVDGAPLVLYVGAERVAVVDEACAVRVVVRPTG
jgi:hypothetical protein